MPHIPASIPASCREVHGRFTFIDYTRCPNKNPIYVALYSAISDDAHCLAAANTYGFMEVREAKGLTFTQFRKAVLAKNGNTKFRCHESNRYFTTQGRTIDFWPYIKNWDGWEIMAIDGVGQEGSFRKWPLAEGDIINANRDGLVTIRNPARHETLVLDLRNSQAPRSYTVKGLLPQ